MDYRNILQTYFELLFFGVFGLSTIFLIATYVASYRWKMLVGFLSYLGVASIPLCFGAISRYFFEDYKCSGVSCQNNQILVLTIYFAVNGTLALHFWAKRSREERAARAAAAKPQDQALPAKAS